MLQAGAKRSCFFAGAAIARPHQLRRRRGQGHARTWGEPSVQDVRNLIVLSGRFFDEQDEKAHMMVAVVTVPFARDMFGSEDAAIGKEFSIQGIPFTIIGIFKESVDTFGQTEIADQTILIPFSVARYFTGTDDVKQIYFTIRSMDEVPEATREIQRVIQARHKPNSVYKTFDLRELLSTADRISIALIVVLVLVAAVTLAVGGVGIMNIMLANVRSRIREIGIRKALGATYREIKLQFLAEAVIISLAGGLVGSFVGPCSSLVDSPLLGLSTAGINLVSGDCAGRCDRGGRSLRHCSCNTRRADGSRRGAEV